MTTAHWFACVTISLLVILVMLGMVGMWHIHRSSHLIPIRDIRVSDLRPGDLLFFRTKEKEGDHAKFLRALVSKGVVGSPYTHVGVVCLHPRDGSLSALEIHISRGCAVLRPLHGRLQEFKNKIAIRRLADRTLEPDRKAVEAFLKHELVPVEQGLRLAHCVSVFQRHILLTCPDAGQESTCADLVVRYLRAAGFWEPMTTTEECCCACTSVSDLFWGNGDTLRLEAPFRPRVVTRQRTQTGGRPPADAR